MSNVDTIQANHYAGNAKDYTSKAKSGSALGNSAMDSARRSMEEARRRARQAQERADRARRMAKKAMDKARQAVKSAGARAMREVAAARDAAARAVEDARGQVQQATATLQKARNDAKNLQGKAKQDALAKAKEIELILAKAKQTMIAAQEIVRQVAEYSGPQKKSQGMNAQPNTVLPPSHGEPVTPGSGYRSRYIAKAGETLASIAESHNCSLDRLLMANPDLGPYDGLSAGQKIQLPALGEFPCWHPGDYDRECDQPFEVVGTMMYEVKPGDTLVSIAARFKVSIKYVKDNLAGRELEPGMHLAMPILKPKPGPLSPVVSPVWKKAAAQAKKNKPAVSVQTNKYAGTVVPT